MRECGNCVACCRLPAIKELAKPFDTLCKFSDGKCCTIYAERPDVCRRFNCMWLQDRLPEQCKPTEIGAVFGDHGEVVTVWVEPDQEWRDGMIWALIEQCLRMAHVCVMQSGTRHFLKGDTKELPEEIAGWRRELL